MIPVKMSDIDYKKNNDPTLKTNYLYYLLILIIFILFFITFSNTNNQKKINKDRMNIINTKKSAKINNSYNKCYLSMVDIRIIHLVITRFLIEFYHNVLFPKKLYDEAYIPNGIRVLKKYLLPSLENQSCKNFTWILMIGDKANISYIKSILNFNNSFEKRVIYQKDIKNYVRNITKGFDVLITTRIDYDDIIYYDAVNDVRKAINIHKPILLYGYNRGVYYFELDGKYYDFYRDYKNEGCMSIFLSLIIVLNKVNDTYIIYDLITHKFIRKKLLKKYKSYGIKKLNYEPAIFDSGDPKFAWVRQNYSGTYFFTREIKKLLTKINNFNLSKFYGT